MRRKEKPRLAPGTEGCLLSERRKNTQSPNVKSRPQKLGSSAHRQLLSKSPAYRREYLETQRDFERWLEKAKSKIGALSGVRDTLNRLEKAGAEPRRILHILAIEVRGRRWLTELRTQKDFLEKVAEHLRTVADELERISAQEASYADFWMVALQQHHAGPVLPPSKRAPHTLLRNMRSHAKKLDSVAMWMGKFSKGATPVVKRQPISLLLADIHARTGSVRKHLVLIAAMLAEEYDAYKIKRKVSPDQLAKVIERHVKFSDKTLP